MKKKIALITGPAAFFVLLMVDMQGLEWEGRAVLASTVWIAIWWISEAIPIAATSLLPVVLFSLTQSVDLKTTTTTYFSPMIMLFLGGFIIALALERWNLHQRIALNIIKWIGTNSSLIILGFMLATAFLSMWISNTATALMMLPIGTAIALKISDIQGASDSKMSMYFTKSLMLSIAYAASIGGMATLIGTPTNAIFSAISLQLYDREVSFYEWFSFGLPVSLILLVLGWIYLTRIRFRTHLKDFDEARSEIASQVKKLGRLSFEEKAVLTVFSLTALAWILRSFVLDLWLPGINDTVIAMTGALALFVIPSRNRKSQIMDWNTAKKLPWGILLLFGGGLTIATGFKVTGLANWLGSQLVVFEHFPLFTMLFILILLINFFTEITSNVATASVLLPVLASLAVTMGVHPYGLMIGATLASSCAFMLPVATPPNAISYSSGYLSMNDMVRTGIWMNLITSLIILLCIYFVLPLIWGLDLFTYPF